MSLMISEANRAPQQVGEILIRVQEDLHQLKERLAAQKDGNQELDIDSIEAAIRRTEKEVQNKTEMLVRHMNNQVMILPSLDAASEHQVESYDLRDRGQPNLDALKKLDYGKVGQQQSILPRDVLQTKGPTPGQKWKTQFNYRAIADPHNSRNREILNDNFGVQLPKIVEKRPMKQESKVVTGSTVDHLAVLPKANRVDASLIPPPITDDDAKKGILSLLERGLIPPAADLTLEPSPVRHRMAPIHDPADRDRQGAAPPFHEGYNVAGVRMDARAVESATTFIDRPKSSSRDVKSAGSAGSVRDSKTPAAMKTFEIQLQPLPPPTTPASMDYKTQAQNHRFAVQNGRVRENNPEFTRYKSHYSLSWGSIVTTTRCLQRMLVKYAIPLAFVDGDKLADLAQDYELDVSPSEEELLECLVNRADIEPLINTPGRKFMGPSGRDLAAVSIQSAYRRHAARQKYLAYRRKKWAAGVIAISWIMNVKMANVKRQLKKARLDNLENFRQKAKTFASSWDRIKKSRRVVIHVPSLGYSQPIRDSISDMPLRQNLQMGRLCDLRDPNVDVILVCPVTLNDETLQYYTKLMGLNQAVKAGSADEQGDLADRFKIIIPEATKHFQNHTMCLSSLLTYSPRCIQRIKNLIKGRTAYLVPGVPHKDDLNLCQKLGVPLLSPEPEVAQLYSTKSGSKRIFVSAGVTMPHGEYDVYSLQQLQECLAQLITEHLDVTRWLFKIDDEFDSRGLAYVDVPDNLKCYQWALKESIRYGEKWSKKWAQEPAYIRIHAEIPNLIDNHAQPLDTEQYPTWQKFMDAFLAKGGVIEACPPSDNVTALTADMLIEPSGHIQLLNVGDQIHADSPYQCWGLSVPQSSVEPEHLNKYCFSVGEACKARGVIGYITIDFVTFINAKTDEQELWAVDLDLKYSDSCAMSNLLHFITEGSMDPSTHMFDVTPPRREVKKKRRMRFKKDEDEDEEPPSTSRYAVMSTRLWHTNLSVVHYSVFFQMCRAHGIGYDIKEKQGSVFTLVDSDKRNHLGLLSIGDNLQGALATFARNLSVIHQEISSPKMQGMTNFKAAIEDIEAILGTTIENAQDLAVGGK